MTYTDGQWSVCVCVCTECSCDPAGAKEVPGYPLGGCGAYTDGQCGQWSDWLIE